MAARKKAIFTAESHCGRRARLLACRDMTPTHSQRWRASNDTAIDSGIIPPPSGLRHPRGPPPPPYCPRPAKAYGDDVRGQRAEEALGAEAPLGARQRRRGEGGWMT